MKPVISHPDAERDWQSAASFYAARNKKLTRDFNDRVYRGFQEIAASPEAFAFVKGMCPVRAYRLPRFPYSIIYIERSDSIWILAVAHARRRPRYWSDRAK